MLSQSAALALPNPSAAQREIDDLIYLYAILPAGALVPLPMMCMDHDRPLYLLENENFRVVVSRVRPQAFEQAALSINLQDAAWLEAHVRLHQHVLDYVVATEKAVLPLRFCTLYRNEAAVQTMLARYRAELAGQLERLTGKQEWGVKLFVAQATLQAAILANDAALNAWGGNDEVARLQAQIATLSRGAAFLFQKKLDVALANKVDTLAFALADHSHLQLAGWAAEVVSNPLRQQQPEMCLNAAYLVANVNLPAFRRTLDVLSETYRAAGLYYELSGPWPAYHFLTLNLAA